jgi:drug/metabolite transporter (DMT)-like permease
MSAPHADQLIKGAFLGLATAMSWALFNVGVAVGQADGFRSADLAMLRYGVAALLLAPVLLTRSGRRIPFGQVAIITVMIGPAFSLLLNFGFSLAPLSHAVVISPGVSMLTANLLLRVKDGRSLPANRKLGMIIMVCGLLAVSGAGASFVGGAWSSLPGDLCFFATGVLWGTMTWLVGRWQLPAVPLTAAVSGLSTVVFLPVYLLVWGPSELPLQLWLQQGVFQGVIGGCLAFVAFAATVQTLGAGRAAVFSALVPPLAVLIGIPATGVWPDAMQWTGVILASVGLVVSLDIARGQKHRAAGPQAAN